MERKEYKMKDEVKKELDETLKVEPKPNPYKELGLQVRELSDLWDAKDNEITKAAITVQWKNENGMVFERMVRVDPEKVMPLIEQTREEATSEFKELCKKLIAD
jgi:RNAse (barnase) inhibitor barstar